MASSSVSSLTYLPCVPVKQLCVTKVWGPLTTFVTHSRLTGTHGRFVKLETEDDATLARKTAENDELANKEPVR